MRISSARSSELRLAPSERVCAPSGGAARGGGSSCSSLRLSRPPMSRRSSSTDSVPRPLRLNPLTPPCRGTDTLPLPLVRAATSPPRPRGPSTPMSSAAASNGALPRQSSASPLSPRPVGSGSGGGVGVSAVNCDEIIELSLDEAGDPRLCRTAACTSQKHAQPTCGVHAVYGEAGDSRLQVAGDDLLEAANDARLPVAPLDGELQAALGDDHRGAAQIARHGHAAAAGDEVEGGGETHATRCDGGVAAARYAEGAAGEVVGVAAMVGGG
eukprot:scaffold86484_cov54-Phaeocystis_antarctica.AAC.8